MSHITYNEFKNRFGDLGITKYTKAMWLEAGCEEIGVYSGVNFAYVDTLATGRRYRSVTSIPDMKYNGGRLSKGIYSQNFNTLYDGRLLSQVNPYDIYAVGNESAPQLDLVLPIDWTDAQCTAYLKDKVILYKKKGYVFLNDWTMKSDVKELTIPLSSRIKIDMKYDLTATGSLATGPWLLSIRRNNSGLQNITTPEVIDSKSYRTIKTNESGIDAVRINTESGAIASGKITSLIIYYTEITEQ